MTKAWVAALAAAALVGSAAAQTTKPPAAAPSQRAPDRPPVWRSLERFSSEAEFLGYVRAVQRLNRQRLRRDSYLGGAVADSAAPPPPPMAAPAPAAQAPGAPAAEARTSTGEPSSITNVQTQGVDEGGIVKMVGRFLVILQDGRLFVTDTRPNGQPGLQLTGRTNVYRRSNAGTWYDELLISGNRILVTGYSYQEAASEVTVFTIDDTGALTREATYFLSSNDYYDPENYSTRLVNGNLVIYTPLNLTYLNTNSPVSWPLVRRWLREGDHRAVSSAGLRLFDARDIYKPVQATYAPMVHSVSVCPLGELRSGDELDCNTTAFVGPPQREFFVSTADIYLWVTANNWLDQEQLRCGGGADASAIPATLYQVPLSGATPRALHVRGQPDSQLAMDASATEFRALLGWNTSRCNRNGRVRDLRYFRAPFSILSTTPQDAGAHRYTAVPSINEAQYEVRFTETHVVYGGRDNASSYPPPQGATRTSYAIAVPVTRPSAVVQVQAPHDIMRIERTGADIVLTGYRDDRGLSLSHLELSGRPHIASTTLLRGRYESESRSHAFNSLIGADGAGLMGLPTVTGRKEAGRWVWRSDSSDVSFIAVDAAGQLNPAGELTAQRNNTHPSYRCEVSCIDWYGNSRALYIGSRVLALSGTELIEGAMANGRIVERRRLNLSAPPARS
jgi:hypothetical protein